MRCRWLHWRRGRGLATTPLERTSVSWLLFRCAVSPGARPGRSPYLHFLAQCRRALRVVKLGLLAKLLEQRPARHFRVVLLVAVLAGQGRQDALEPARL